MDFREVGDHYDRFQSMEGPHAEDPAVAVMFSMAYGDVAGHLRVIDVTQSLGSEAQTLLQWQRRHDNHYAFYSVFGFGGIVRCIPQIIAEIDDDSARPFAPIVWAMRAEADEASWPGSSEPISSDPTPPLTTSRGPRSALMNCDGRQPPPVLPTNCGPVTCAVPCSWIGTGSTPTSSTCRAVRTQRLRPRRDDIRPAHPGAARGRHAQPGSR